MLFSVSLNSWVFLSSDLVHIVIGHTTQAICAISQTPLLIECDQNVTRYWIFAWIPISTHLSTLVYYMSTSNLHGSKKSQAGMLDSRVLSSILSSWPNFSIAMELVAFCQFLEVPSAQKDKYNFSMTRSKPGRHGSSTDVEATNLPILQSTLWPLYTFLSWASLLLKAPHTLQLFSHPSSSRLLLYWNT